MRSVSSDASRSRTSVSPSASAASSRTRLEMLFDPGRRTLPAAERSWGRSRNSMDGTLPGAQNRARLVVELGISSQAAVRPARSRLARRQASTKNTDTTPASRPPTRPRARSRVFLGETGLSVTKISSNTSAGWVYGTAKAVSSAAITWRCLKNSNSF